MSESVLPPQTQTPLRVYGAIAAGVVAISLAAIFIRLAQAEAVPSPVIAAARLALATLVLAPPTLKRHASELRRIARREWLLIGTSGFFLALHFATWTFSLEYTSVLISVVLITTSPLWIALLETIFLKAQLQPPVVMGLAIAFIGGILIAVPGNSDPLAGTDTLLGSLLSLCGAVAVAIYFVIGRKLRATLPLLPYIWLVYGCAALILLAVLLVTGIPITGYSAQGYLWLATLALIPQLIGHSSFNYAVRYLPATLIGLTMQLEPVGSALIAFFLFNESPHSLQLAGSVAILVGVALASQNRPASPE